MHVVMRLWSQQAATDCAAAVRLGVLKWPVTAFCFSSPDVYFCQLSLTQSCSKGACNRWPTVGSHNRTPKLLVTLTAWVADFCCQWAPALQWRATTVYDIFTFYIKPCWSVPIYKGDFTSPNTTLTSLHVDGHSCLFAVTILSRSEIINGLSNRNDRVFPRSPTWSANAVKPHWVTAMIYQISSLQVIKNPDMAMLQQQRQTPEFSVHLMSSNPDAVAPVSPILVLRNWFLATVS